jgi:moderate conductance mechanosensitive channel
MRGIVDTVPLPRPLAVIVVITALFLAAVVISRLAGLVAGRLAARRALPREGESEPSTVALARLRRRETAASLTQTTVRYLAFTLAIVLSIVAISGGRRTETLAGGAFLAIVLGFAVQRVLADFIAGLLMFFEDWFEVGDTITIEPWALSGVVEEVSLRSLTLRNLSGEVIRVQNSQVLATRVVPHGVRELEIELFVSDALGGQQLVELLGRIVPQGPTQFIRPPGVVETEELGDGLFRITATASVAPGREWLAEDLLPKLVHERGGDIVVHGPVVTPMDEQAARRYARAAWLGRGRPQQQDSLGRFRSVERRFRRVRASD